MTQTRRIVRRTVDDLRADARARIHRYEPAQARAAVRNGALIVDLRSADERLRDGVVPGSLHVPRTVLEWRAALEARGTTRTSAASSRS
jgi:hypothetical protein